MNILSGTLWKSSELYAPRRFSDRLHRALQIGDKHGCG